MTTASLNLRGRLREVERGKRWAKELPSDRLHEFIDGQVLGDFDWREWFETKPSGTFLNAAFDEAQYIEETT